MKRITLRIPRFLSPTTPRASTPPKLPRNTTAFFRPFSAEPPDPKGSTPAPDPDPTPSAFPNLEYPTSKSPNHHSLPSFLQHASRTNLDPSSTVYIGTHFEYTVLSALAPYGFSLRRIGGASDAGIDLLGTWSPPSTPSPPTFRVILQCKVTASPRPSLIRELEGAFIGAPAGWKTGGVLGFLVADRKATKGIREALGRSRWPMGFIYCSRGGVVEQMMWNLKAAEQGLEGFEVARRHGPGGETRVALTFRGEGLPFVGGGGGIERE